MTLTTTPLTVITGPSGVGKGSLVKELLERNKDVWLSISATTRLPRQGEVDGEHYSFLKHSEFEDLIDSNGFLEWAEFAGNYYGTPLMQISEKISEGRKVLLEIELEGARQVRINFPGSLQIFIAPPSFEELEKRIRGRGTDSEEAISRRLYRAKEEINAKNEFDAVVINNDLHVCLFEIEQLMGI